jgi:hypothetical protein
LLFLGNGLVFVVLDFLFEPLPNTVAQARGPLRSHVSHSCETDRFQQPAEASRQMPVDENGFAVCPAIYGTS